MNRQPCAALTAADIAAQVVLDILPSPQHKSFKKEDGDVVIDAQCHRAIKHS
ncbi:MAG: hypothetical protein IT507_11640 [Burkholderiaceae bacterium]|nr:hypothetical protein [Burkholderiaceae bacterium]